MGEGCLWHSSGKRRAQPDSAEDRPLPVALSAEAKQTRRLRTVVVKSNRDSLQLRWCRCPYDTVQQLSPIFLDLQQEFDSQIVYGTLWIWANLHRPSRPVRRLAQLTGQ